MDNDIIKFLNFKDKDILVKSVHVKDSTKYVEIEKPVSATFCPICQSKMKSKGIRIRSVNHPILQDGFKVIILLRQRRWLCTNELCRYLMNDEFTFVEPRRRNTNLADFLILQEFKNISHSVSDIAKRFNVSDTYALQTFDRYVDLDRLPLTEAICIDEVFTDMENDKKYALLIQDFCSGELIDVLESRREHYTAPYFSSIPMQERKKVRYLITDMYRPYINYIDKYFPYAKSVIDSFHVIKALNHSIDKFITSLLRKFKSEDEKRKVLKELELGHKVKLPVSDEVYLLKNHKWVLLRNVSNIDYNKKSKQDWHFKYYMDTYDYESRFMKIHPDFERIRALKEEYIEFNTNYTDRADEAAVALSELIEKYRQSDIEIFSDFSYKLEEHFDAIVRSFKVLPRLIDGKESSSRLSNGPLESMNRKPKDMRRIARGYTNFEHFRNRLLFATRKDAPILAVPKTRKEVLNYTGVQRSPYSKKADGNPDQDE